MILKMPKLQSHQTSIDKVDKTLSNLSSYLAEKNNPKQIKIFLNTVLTESETIMVARRIQVADLLLAGSTYEEIMKHLKVGLTTINKVNSTIKKYLSDENIRKKIFERDKWDKAAYGTFNHLRKTYKGYFGLLNAILDK